ncbi:MAG: HINT domain-containing protein [Actinomadura sp.]
MADGTRKPIDELKVGDKVLATDPATGKTASQTVLTAYDNAGTKHTASITSASRRCAAAGQGLGGPHRAKHGRHPAVDRLMREWPCGRTWTVVGAC